MIVVRDVFRLKFGKAKEAQELWKEGIELARRLGMHEPRLLTDRVGPFYTLVLESAWENLGEWEKLEKKALGSKDWSAWYVKFVPLVESGYREVLRVVAG